MSLGNVWCHVCFDTSYCKNDKFDTAAKSKQTNVGVQNPEKAVGLLFKALEIQEFLTHPAHALLYRDFSWNTDPTPA